MPRYIDIDRQINASDLIEWIMETYTDWCEGRIRSIVDHIGEMPTISPDEVCDLVHCGECVHADKDLPGAIYCTMWDAWEVPEDGFCYKGAKMEVASDA